MDVLGFAFVVAAVAVAGYAMRDQLPDVIAGLARLSWWAIAGAFALVVAGLLATAEVWRHSLAALGHPVSPTAARQIFFPAQVGKYLPGAVWPFLAQMRLARRHGVPARAALLAGAVFLAVHTVTSVLAAGWLLVAEPALGAYRWLGLACLPLALAALHPQVVNWLARKASKGMAPPDLRWPQLVRPMLWMVPAWLFYGAACALLALPFAGAGPRLAVVCTAAFALGWLVGLVVFIAPAGAGAREAVLIVVLAPALGVAAATTVSLMARVCHTVADVLLALGYGLARGRSVHGSHVGK